MTGQNVMPVWKLVLKDVKISQIAWHSTIMVLKIHLTKTASCTRGETLGLSLRTEESEWQVFVLQKVRFITC